METIQCQDEHTPTRRRPGCPTRYGVTGFPHRSKDHHQWKELKNALHTWCTLLELHWWVSQSLSRLTENYIFKSIVIFGINMAENAAFSLSNMEMFLLLCGSYHIELNLLVLDCWSDKTRHVEPSHQILRNYDGHFFFFTIFWHLIDQKWISYCWKIICRCSDKQSVGLWTTFWLKLLFPWGAFRVVNSLVFPKQRWTNHKQWPANITRPSLK